MRNKISCALTIGSALLYTLALHWPHYCWWLMLFYLMPLYYGALMQYQFNVVMGFAWGCIAFGVHFGGLYPTFAILSYNCIGIFLILLLFLYFSLWSALWFWLASFLGSVLRGRLLAWSVATLVFILLLDKVALFWVPPGCGYGLLHPALALGGIGGTFFSNDMLLFLLIIIAIIGAALLHAVKLRYCLIIFLALTFMIEEKFQNFPKREAPFIYLDAGSKKSLFDCAQEIAIIIQRGMQRHPTTNIVVLPEGAFAYPLNELPFVAAWWIKPESNKHLFIGAHRKENGALYNSMYHIYNGAIVDWYDKRCLVPVAEYVPTWLAWLPGIRAIFLEGFNDFSCGAQEKVFVVDDVRYQPIICSELFLNLAEVPKGVVPLFIMNNSWFYGYFKELLNRFVNLKATCS